ncbi:MAG: sugar phosphate isomerase/epimerase [Lachnospira sp.]|nr:sugar phosphate isomerase/epimerase [Lachnospira sp.]
MKQLLIIPDVNDILNSIELAKKYNVGFEYNDFFVPDILDDEDKLQSIIAEYKSYELPEYTTLHGAFFDVIPFSVDKKIREISNLRIEKSIEIAKNIGAKAVVFHINHNSFLNSKSYIEDFVETNTKYWSNVLQKNRDINIYLENMFETTPMVIEAISKNLCKYDNYGVCLDYAHAFLSKCSLKEWAKSLSPYIRHVHINDNDGISDLHLPLDDGIIPGQEFYECYDKYMNNATVLIETTDNKGKVKSLEILKRDGFID